MAKLIYSLNDFDHGIAKGNGIIKAATITALDEARNIIDVANEKAEQIDTRAQRRYESEKKRGYREGRERADLDSFARLISEQRQLDRTLANLEMAVADLVKASVRKIVSEFDDATLVYSVVTRALTKIRREGQMQIHMPPGMRDTFVPIASKLEAAVDGIGPIELVEDHTLEVPAFVVESGAGRLECNVPRRLRALETLIDDIVKQNLLNSQAHADVSGGRQ